MNISENKHHGGDIGWANEYFGSHKDGWLDLSTGINPNQYPFEIEEKYDFNSLPSKARLDECLEAAQQYYGCDSTENILLAPGSQILINQLPFIFEDKSVAIVSPTYGEHAPAWRNAKHIVTSVTSPLDTTSDIVLLVNPNNPDGKLYKPDELLSFAKRQHAKGGYLVIDEAFIDIEPSMSCSRYASAEGLIILRSFGKFFGLGGLRLGALLAPTSICEALRKRVGPWAVSSIALSVTTKAYSDDKWITNQRDELSRSTMRLDDLLIKACGEVIGGTDLYRLVSHKHATKLFNHLGGDGIYVRHFEYNNQWLRFGLLSENDEASWNRLEESLKKFIA